MKTFKPPIRLLATDIDGTLLNPQFEISEGDLTALRRAHSSGIEIVLVTGRRHTFALPIAQQLGFDLWLISSNGAITRSLAGETFYRDMMPAETCRRLCAAMQEFRGNTVLTFDKETKGALVLEHLDEPRKLFQEASRILRPNGRFLLTTPNREALPYRILHLFPESAIRKLAASWTQESLHPELLHHDHSSGLEGHPDRHRTEGFTVAEVEALGDSAGFHMLLGYTYRIPLPDRMMEVLTPRTFSRSVAALGTRPLPFGLQVYAEFARR